MNEFNSLREKDIYAIPAGDIWHLPPHKLFFIYSPLSGHVLLLKDEEVERLEKILLGNEIGNELQNNILKTFIDNRNLFVFQMPKSEKDIYEVDILSNFKCNFSCSYCYSAKGRSSKELEFNNIKILADYLFLSGSHPHDKSFKINFSGGGEPLLSFSLIKESISYINKITENLPVKYSYALVTNGSLLTSEIIDYIKEQKINLVVSFEVLQEFQDMERGSYDKVARNINLLLEKKCSFGIRATITPQSVSYMKKMVEELEVHFPKLKAIVFDTVLSSDIFKKPVQLQQYYDDFTTNYISAKEYGKRAGILVRCNALEPLLMLRDRTCQGKIVLTPNGFISSCARISSPLEDLYDKFIYGEIHDGTIEFNTKKLEDMMNANNIYSRRECRTCYARWNCGGGCWLFSLSFPDEFEQPFCDFTKQSLKRNVFEMLSTQFAKIHQKDLWGKVNEQIVNENMKYY